MAAMFSQVSADCMACKTTAEMVEVKALTASETIPKAAATELVWDMWLVSAPVSAGMTSHVFDDLTLFGLVAQDMEENFAAERFLGDVSWNTKCKINDDKTIAQAAQPHLEMIQWTQWQRNNRLLEREN